MYNKISAINIQLDFSYVWQAKQTFGLELYVHRFAIWMSNCKCLFKLCSNFPHILKCPCHARRLCKCLRIRSYIWLRHKIQNRTLSKIFFDITAIKHSYRWRQKSFDQSWRIRTRSHFNNSSRGLIYSRNSNIKL